MPPKKKVERAATENISLGPQVREGMPGCLAHALMLSTVPIHLTLGTDQS